MQDLGHWACRELCPALSGGGNWETATLMPLISAVGTWMPLCVILYLQRPNAQLNLVNTREQPIYMPLCPNLVHEYYSGTCLKVYLPKCIQKPLKRAWFLWNKGIPLYLSKVWQILGNIPLGWQWNKASQGGRWRTKEQFWFQTTHINALIQRPLLLLMHQRKSGRYSFQSCCLATAEPVFEQLTRQLTPSVKTTSCWWYWGAVCWARHSWMGWGWCIRTWTHQYVVWRWWSWRTKSKHAGTIIERVTQCSQNPLQLGSVLCKCARVFWLVLYSLKHPVHPQSWTA